MRIRLPLLLVASAAVAAAGAACAGGHVKTTVFDDGFGGTFPGTGWQLAGPAPGIVTTAGNPAPSLAWPACLGSSGGVARASAIFNGAGGVLAAVDFAVTGSAGSAGTNVAFHAVGLDGFDDASAVVFPPPTNRIGFELDGQPLNVSLPADHAFHQLVFHVDADGTASWLADGATLMVGGPFATTSWGVQLECAETGTAALPIPILLDNIHIEAIP